jgi:acyl-coenzyme A synthetase/AMP-(fatty) acid ligase
MRSVTSYLDIVTEDRIASVLPLSFVYGMSQVLCAVGTGATLVIERSPLVQQLLLHLRAKQVTVLAAVPPLWLQMIRAPAFGTAWASLRIMTNAGGHLPAPAVRALRRAQPQAQLYLMYGLTEALRSTFLSPNEVDHRPDSIGRAIPGAEVLVLRDDLTPCGTDEVGELVHCGPTVTLGYWNDPDATARVFRPHPFRDGTASHRERVVFSGDLVRRDAAGYFYFVGRQDRQFKTLGYRVSPEEIANVLYSSGEVVEAVVTSEPDELRGERIVACVVLAGGGSLERLTMFCRSELPSYMQPARFEVRQALPQLPNGKHDLAALRGAGIRRR